MFIHPQAVGESYFAQRSFAANTYKDTRLLYAKCDVCGKEFRYRELDKKTESSGDVEWSYVNCPNCRQQVQFAISTISI